MLSTILCFTRLVCIRLCFFYIKVRKDLLWSLHAEVESGSSNLVLHSLRDLMLQQLGSFDMLWECCPLQWWCHELIS